MSGLLSSKMPLFLEKINYISPIPYIARYLAVNEFNGATFSCISEEIQSGRCIYPTGRDVLELLGEVSTFDVDKVGFYMGISTALIIAYRIIAYIILKIKAG